MYQKGSRKAILSPSGDQEDTYRTYIHPNWPDIKTLPAGVGGVALGYEAQATVSAEDSVYYGADWTMQNISSRGPFGALYRVWGDGKQMVKGDIFDYFGLASYTADQLKAKGYIVWTPPRAKGSFIGEGDTFTYLNLIDNGLQGYADDSPGGWAGLGAGGATLSSDCRSWPPRAHDHSHLIRSSLPPHRTGSPLACCGRSPRRTPAPIMSPGCRFAGATRSPLVRARRFISKGSRPIRMGTR